ncbi:MAG: pantetheine-phosphate adenylyltransferase [Flavobacteriales bacterium]|nr:pantetheine-phosphate adenylyltransferase [Flavobacteriales bacterium]
MEKVAVFPGSFDPITKGHESIIKRALPLFDKIVVAIGVNSSKKYMFSLEQRLNFCKKTFGDDKISVETYEGLTIDYCSTIGAKYLLRGLRTSADFEFERGIAQMNNAMNLEIETIFMLTPPELSAISSTIVRDIIKNGGDVSQFIPKGISL